MQIQVADLHPSPLNPRKSFTAIDELAASIKAHGVLEPLLVRKNAKGFEIIAGERRWRAATKLHLVEVPCVVREFTDEQALEVMLVENVQREDLTPLEQADAYVKLQTNCKLTVDQISERTGKTKATIYARLKLAQLGPEGRKAFAEGIIGDASTALLVARLPATVQRKALHVLAPRPDDDPGPFSYRQAADLISRFCYRRLQEAPWNQSDPNVLAGVPACAGCPKNSKNFPPAERPSHGADVCTDLECWDRKLSVVFKDLVAKAEKTGGGALSAADLKLAFDESGDLTWNGPFDPAGDSKKGGPRFVAMVEGAIHELVRAPVRTQKTVADYERRIPEDDRKRREKVKQAVAKLEALLGGLQKAKDLPDWFWKNLYEQNMWHLPEPLRKRLNADGHGGRIAAVLAIVARGDPKLLEQAQKTWGTPAKAPAKAPAAPAKKAGGKKGR